MGGRVGEDGVAIGFSLCFDEYSSAGKRAIINLSLPFLVCVPLPLSAFRS